MEELKAWFENPDYETGCRYYLQLIGKDYVYELLSLGENSYTRSKLISSLQDFYENLPVERKETPEEIRDFQARAQELMNERSELKAFLRAQYLNSIDNLDTRTAAVQRVLAIRPELDRLMGNVQLYKTEGIVVTAQSNESQEEDLKQKYLNLRSDITRYSKCLRIGKSLAKADLTNERRQVYEIKLAELLAEKVELETKLDNAVFIEPN